MYLTIPKHCGESEVGDFDVVAVVEEEILRLQIAMRYASRVQIVNAIQDLIEVALRAADRHANVGLCD